MWTTFGATLGILAAQGLLLGVALIIALFASALIFGAGAIVDALAFLSSTWLLQTVVAAWVALTFQRANAESNRKLDSLAKSYDRKVHAVKSLTRLVDQRIYASRRYLFTIENDTTGIDLEREHYRITVDRWNSEIKEHQISILLDFDSYYGLEFDHLYSPTFSRLDTLLRKQRILVQAGKAVDRGASVRIRDELASLNLSSLRMMREMLRIAREDRDVLDSRPELRRENLAHLSKRQILSALFAVREQS